MTACKPIRVAIAGFGRLASDIARGLASREDISIVGVARRQADGATVHLAGSDVPVFSTVGGLLAETEPDVLFEATLPEHALTHASVALDQGVRPVIATSGLSENDLDHLARTCVDARLGGVFAPNLSIGAVVLMHLAAIAGRYFDHAEIIEYHRDRKADAPSGTAAHTARLMQRARGASFLHVPSQTITLGGVRGGEAGGIGIHSVRLPGLVAHQEVILGGIGQTLTLRHDAMSNDSYVPGAVLAIKHATATAGLTVGLGALLGLEA
jgi:4-hydroxy-tetrahydrodipicolinate reductase